MKNLTSTLKLNNGVDMPIFGLGVYKSAGDTKEAVKAALAAGYRHIDTATLYHNEAQVGEAVKESGIPRNELFITTKLWNDDMRAGRQMEAFEESLEKLKMDYVDLYMLHWPVSEALEDSWKVLEEIYRSGRARAIGVCNCYRSHLERILAAADVVPAVNQVECHPYLTLEPLRRFCKEKGIAVTAWSPLGRGHLLQDPVITAMSEQYGKTPAQIVLRWEIEEGIIVIPKSVHAERIIENTKVFDFALSPADHDRIQTLNRDQHFGTSPDNFETRVWP